MQYILSQKEYDDLRFIHDAKVVNNTGKLQTLCSTIADTMPHKFWGNEEPAIWGCILTKGKSMGYCDECPAKEICPHTNKSWSK
jgi:hypothetical protein